MKLRIRGNSVRLRLTRSEVERLAAEGRLTETVDLGRKFAYEIVADDVDDVSAAFDGATIRVTLPRSKAMEWAGTERVGIEAFTAGVRVAVEKDFACLTPRREEDESDMFDHPALKAC